MPETNWSELFDLMQAKLYTGLISDVLDDLGYRNQAMTADIRPVYPEAVVVGRAHTVRATDVYSLPEKPYEMEIAAVDALKKDDVLVATTNRSTRTGFWGELLSTAARVRGARGAIMDGYTRDTRQIIKMQFPVFATGMRPLDSKGRSLVLGYGEPIECGGISVRPGDLIFGDNDGVMVIPQEVAEETVRRALEKAGKENITRDELLKGGYLGDVYAKYGVL